MASLTIDVLNKFAIEYELSKNESSNGLKNYSESWKELFKQFKNDEVNLFFNAPAMIIVLIDNNRSLSPVLDGSIDGSLVACSMELMTNALNLGACYNVFFAYAAKDESIGKYLNTPDNKKVVISLLIGYPDIKYLRTVPRKKSEIEFF